VTPKTKTIEKAWCDIQKHHFSRWVDITYFPIKKSLCHRWCHCCCLALQEVHLSTLPLSLSADCCLPSSPKPATPPPCSCRQQLWCQQANNWYPRNPTEITPTRPQSQARRAKGTCDCCRQRMCLDAHTWMPAEGCWCEYLPGRKSSPPNLSWEWWFVGRGRKIPCFLLLWVCVLVRCR